MKNILKTSLRSFIALSFVSVFAVAAAHAQNREEHFISARAGGVNFVAGDVRARLGGESNWQRLSVKDDLKSGDAVRTGAEGRVEVLLNPGSYFRAGEGTEFELVDASLDDLRLRLSRGSALVEATGYEGLDLSIVISTPQTRVRIARAGVYRINVSASGVTEVAVQKGRAFVGEGAATTRVKGGQLARVGAGGVEVAKLDKKKPDTLDQWSHDRAKELARANEKISRRNTLAMLAQARTNGLFGRDFGSGFWLWNGLAGCYTFLPFYESWRSPYGFGYNTFFGCYGCGYGYVGSGGTGSGTPYPGTSGGGGSSSGGNTSGGTPAPVVSRPEPPPMRSEPSPPPPRESAPSAPSPHESSPPCV